MSRIEKEPPPFPVLLTEEDKVWQWPLPPFRWRHAEVSDGSIAQPCRIESNAGTAMDGKLVGFDPISRSIDFRVSDETPVVKLPFLRFRRLTLTVPLTPAPRSPTAPIERVPAAAQVRDYELKLRGPKQDHLVGRTAGHVVAHEGLYLFAPQEEDESLLRMFVPRTTYTEVRFGPSAEELAAELWIATRHDLLQALERQNKRPVPRLGQALLELGLLTKASWSGRCQRLAGSNNDWVSSWCRVE